MLGKQKSSNSKKSKKKSANLFGAACLLLGLLILLIAFLVKKDQIKRNLAETAFFDRVFGSTPTFIEAPKGKAKETEKKKSDTITFNLNNSDDLSEGDGSAVEEAPKTEKITIGQLKGDVQTSNTAQSANGEQKTEKPSATAAATEPAASDISAGDKSVSKKEPEVKKVETPKAEATKPVSTPVPAKTELSLCFTVIDADGSVSRKIIKRSVQKNDSPLTTAINLLLAGPDFTISGERNLRSFIPKGTRLLGARVSNGVATLNFSDDIEFNDEGTIGQINALMQIVYTATSFSTVNSVQFLINGQKKEYFGEEGIRIGTPLSKTSFK